MPLPALPAQCSAKRGSRAAEIKRGSPKVDKNKLGQTNYTESTNKQGNSCEYIFLGFSGSESNLRSSAQGWRKFNRGAEAASAAPSAPRRWDRAGRAQLAASPAPTRSWCCSSRWCQPLRLPWERWRRLRPPAAAAGAGGGCGAPEPDAVLQGQGRQRSGLPL